MRRHAVRLALALAGTSCGFAAAGAFSALLPLRGSAQLRATLASAACRGAAPQHAAERLRGGGESMAAKLGELGQGHLLEGLSEDKQLALLAQAEDLDSQLPGGLEGYIRSAKKLLQDSKEGANPFEGFTPSVPTGQSLDPSSEEFLKMEAAGLSAVSETGFILVAGGLGERLGYQGIKVSLPLYDAERDKCFLSLYIGHILDMQANHGNSRRIPLAIMTSDDTHALTEQLLKDNNYFGMEPDQLTIMKQNKVPALKDSDARFASSDGLIATKPHGHGDVHTLMHQTGLAKKWLDSGIKHIVFFQDTNGIIFRALPAVLGVSVTHQFAVNSVCVPRTPGEAVGGICKLTHTDGREVTVNVEYNQLDPLLKCSEDYRQGDAADASGHSPFPGNINILAMHLPTYTQTLQSTGGRVNEFVNPKYVDESKTAFKSPTRLECMMQDFPLLLPKAAKVGFTTLPREICFSPVKNNVKDAAGKQEKGLPIECAASAERDAYHLNGMLLRLAGAKVDVEENAEKMYAGIKINFPPLITLLPSFATSLTQVKSHMRPGADVHVTARSALVLEGDVDIEGSLHVDGAVEIRAAPGAKIVVKSLKVANKGWFVTSVESSNDVLTAMRGFKVVKEETKIFEAVEGELVIE